VTAISGVFCLAAELLMILSLYMYEDSSSTSSSAAKTTVSSVSVDASTVDLKNPNGIDTWVRDMHAFLITTLMVSA
jgi:hypothetical protein